MYVLRVLSAFVVCDLCVLCMVCVSFLCTFNTFSCELAVCFSASVVRVFV